MEVSRERLSDAMVEGHELPAGWREWATENWSDWARLAGRRLTISGCHLSELGLIVPPWGRQARGEYGQKRLKM